MSLNAYWAYGLRIHAEMVCPELPSHPQPAGIPDVTIRLLSPVSSVSETLENGYFEVQPGVFRLAVPGVARYQVEHGNSILIEPLAEASPEEIRLYLLGSTMGALLYQRGLFPLHGSAIETRWGAMIFVGDQGAGKSTLAAHFHRKGYRLLSDDVCAVATSGGGLQILPSLSQFRLCPDAYERLGTQAGARFDVDKFVVPLGEGYCPDPVLLRAIHVICDQDAETPKFEVLRGFDRVQTLLKNLYRPHYLKGQETQADLMRLAGRIAQRSALVAVNRRRDATHIEALVSFLEMAWTKHFALNLPKETIRCAILAQKTDSSAFKM
jgi:hypothetical protein